MFRVGVNQDSNPGVGVRIGRNPIPNHFRVAKAVTYFMGWLILCDNYKICRPIKYVTPVSMRQWLGLGLGLIVTLTLGLEFGLTLKLNLTIVLWKRL